MGFFLFLSLILAQRITSYKYIQQSANQSARYILATLIYMRKKTVIFLWNNAIYREIWA